MAAGAGLGVESYLRLKKEATWGTAETTGFLLIPFSQEDVHLEIEKIDAENIVAGVARDASLAGPRSVQGTIRGQMTYNAGVEQLLYACLGTATQSTPGGGTVTRDKWFEAAALLPSFTIEKNAGNIEDTPDVHIFTGCKVNRFSLTIPDRGALTFEATIFGKDDASNSDGSATAGGSAGTEDATGTQYILSHGPSSTSFIISPTTGVDVLGWCVKSLTVNVDRKMTPQFCAGSNTMSQPNPEDFIEVTGELVVELLNKDIYQAFRSFADVVSSDVTGTIEDVNRFLFRGGSAPIEGALRYEFEVFLSRLRWLAPSMPYIDRRGKLLVRCPFECFGNAGTAAPVTADARSSKQPIAFRFRNKLQTTNY